MEIPIVMRLKLLDEKTPDSKGCLPLRNACGWLINRSIKEGANLMFSY